MSRLRPGESDAMSTAEVAKFAGVSYRRIDYWVRNGILTPSVEKAEGSGCYRYFSLTDALEALMISTALVSGYSLSAVRRSLPGIRAAARGDLHPPQTESETA